MAGRDPNVFLADVVAASACFPGFRPVVFRRDEVGLTESTNASPAAEWPRRHHTGGRLLLGIVGVVGIAVAVGAVAIRILGPLDAGWSGLGIAAALLMVGCAIAYLSVRMLWLRDDMVLVDGGVYDNLGAAFALLAKDDRYPELPGIAGADSPGLMLVVDASKPFTEQDKRSRGLGELVPLRVRGAQRSVLKLLGNANSAARKLVVELVLRSEGPITGDVVSISDIPNSTDRSGAKWEYERVLDWPATVKRTTTATPTTLDALEIRTIHGLLLQSYRLTQSKLAEHGVELIRERTSGQILHELVLPRTWPKEIWKLLRTKLPIAQWPAEARTEFWKIHRTTDVEQVLAKAKGPYARQARRVRWIFRTVLIAAVLILLYQR
jgi:hypothetical protein